MIATDRLIAALNRQIGNEMGASLQYTVLAAHFDGQTLPELAKFFYRQSDEERAHAMKFVHFVNDVGGKVAIPAIPAPKSEFTSAEAAVQLALDWERQVTQQIYDLTDIATEDRNHIARRFLDWFVDEQLEEMKTMAGLLQVIQRAGEDRLIYVEDYLAREGVPPEPEAGT
jgi:bacterioferritin B